MSITVKADGSVTVQTVAEAAEIMKLLRNGVHKPQVELPMFASAGLPTAEELPANPSEAPDAEMLLRIGGMKQVKKSTLKIYTFLLGNRTKAWTAPMVAGRIKHPVQATSICLQALAKRKIIERVGFGQYKAK